MAVIEMTKRMREALDECVRYTDQKRLYFWRKASMKKLVDLGYAEEGNSRCWVPTQAGRDYLSGEIRPLPAPPIPGPLPAVHSPHD